MRICLINFTERPFGCLKEWELNMAILLKWNESFLQFFPGRETDLLPQFQRRWHIMGSVNWRGSIHLCWCRTRSFGDFHTPTRLALLFIITHFTSPYRKLCYHYYPPPQSGREIKNVFIPHVHPSIHVCPSRFSNQTFSIYLHFS